MLAASSYHTQDPFPRRTDLPDTCVAMHPQILPIAPPSSRTSGKSATPPPLCLVIPSAGHRMLARTQTIYPLGRSDEQMIDNPAPHIQGACFGRQFKLNGRRDATQTARTQTLGGSHAPDTKAHGRVVVPHSLLSAAVTGARHVGCPVRSSFCSNKYCGRIRASFRCWATPVKMPPR